jgi:hypothetical protein
MKLTAAQVFVAHQIVRQIVEEKRPLPLKGAYRLGRLLTKLQPEFEVIAKKRDELITAYDYKTKVNGGDEEQLSVPPDKMGEFLANWRQIADETIEVAVEPVPLSQLDTGKAEVGPLTVGELIGLGDLVADDAKAD